MRRQLILGAIAGAALATSTAEAAAWGYCQVWHKCERIVADRPSYPPRITYYRFDRPGRAPVVYRYVDRGGYFYKPSAWQRVTKKAAHKPRAKRVRKATKPLK